MYSHRTKSSDIQSRERGAPEIRLSLPIYLPLKFSFNIVRMYRKRLNNKMIFQQDDTPLHLSKEVCTWLHGNFRARWIDRTGSICWALCSPDLTPFDFVL